MDPMRDFAHYLPHPSLPDFITIRLALMQTMQLAWTHDPAVLVVALSDRVPDEMDPLLRPLSLSRGLPSN
jgi:hypothetical protein